MTTAFKDNIKQWNKYKDFGDIVEHFWNSKEKPAWGNQPRR